MMEDGRPARSATVLGRQIWADKKMAPLLGPLIKEAKVEG